MIHIKERKNGVNSYKDAKSYFMKPILIYLTNSLLQLIQNR